MRRYAEGMNLLPLLLAAAVHAAPRSCPPGTVAFDGYCMDKYEAPNVAGEKPFAYSTAQDGEKWCREERAKGTDWAGRFRLCKDVEWNAACRSKDGRRFPYGTTYKKGTCNDDKQWRVPDWNLLAQYPKIPAIRHAQALYQGEPSGSRAECVSPEGVHDLTGNVAEWVVRTQANNTNYGHVMKGCYWVGCYANSTPDCSFANNAHPGSFRSYEVGFRCCADRD